MNKLLSKAKTNIINQKKMYLFLITVLLIGIISGIIFIFLISKEDKLLVKDELDSFFEVIKNNKLDNIKLLINNLGSNLLYLIIIWLLGISIIGIPFIIFLLFFKGFVLGFSIVSIITNYGIKGIILSLIYHLPHSFILITLYLLLSFYAISFSIKLSKILFKKENINLNMCFKKYNKILLISTLGIIICNLYNVFIVPILINFLVNLS